MYLGAKGTGEDWARYAAALERLVSHPNHIQPYDHVEQLVGWANSELPVSPVPIRCPSQGVEEFVWQGLCFRRHSPSSLEMGGQNP